MKRFFIVTYWVHLEHEKVRVHSVSKSYIWEAPIFYDWVIEIRNKLSKELNVNLVIINCGKV